jgi:hypothetical protein
LSDQQGESMKRNQKSPLEQAAPEIQSWIGGDPCPMPADLAARSRGVWPGKAGELAAWAARLDALDDAPWRLKNWLAACEALAPMSEKERSERSRFSPGQMGAAVAAAWAKDGSEAHWGKRGGALLRAAASLDDAMQWDRALGTRPAGVMELGLGGAVADALRARPGGDKDAAVEVVNRWLAAGADPNALSPIGGPAPRAPLEAALGDPLSWTCAAALAQGGAVGSGELSFKAAAAIHCALTWRLGRQSRRRQEEWTPEQARSRVKAALSIAKALGPVEHFRTKKGMGLGRLMFRALLGSGQAQAAGAAALDEAGLAWSPQDFADAPAGLERAKRPRKLPQWAMAARLMKGKALADGAWAEAFADARTVSPWDATVYAEWTMSWASGSQWSEKTLQALSREAKAWGRDLAEVVPAAKMEGKIQELGALELARTLDQASAKAPAARSKPKGL